MPVITPPRGIDEAGVLQDKEKGRLKAPWNRPAGGQSGQQHQCGNDH
jgi:hypothetical protein